MYLKRLEINGFKSFAKKGDLDFSVPIVAIVGPNGSGKSNVAEAFRFVLGEQSMKSMRGKRGEDLIFTGSKTAGKMNRASVKLVFDNTRRIFNIDFDEVLLERVVHRDSVNEYLINGSQVRLRDILELLASANIGASGHHIISQGEADRILNTSIKERKAMIEDALGLKVYQYKRLESERKLEKTQQNIKQVESLRKEIAPHIKFLEKQVEKAKRVEGLRDELLSFYKEYLAREEQYLHVSKTTLKTKEEAPKHEFHQLETTIDRLKREIAESDSDPSKTEEILAIECALREAEEELSELKNSISRLEGEKSAQERALFRSVHQVSEKKLVNVALEDLEHLEREMKEAVKESQTSAEAHTLRAILHRIVALLTHFIASKKEHATSPDMSGDIKEEIAVLEKNIEDKKQGLVAASEEVARSRAHYEAFRKAREEETSRGREAERELFSLMNRRSELNQILFSLHTEAEKLHREEVLFKAELQEAQALLGVQVLHYHAPAVLAHHELREVQEDHRRKLEKMKIRLEEAGGALGEEVKKEYDEALERDQFLAREITDLSLSAQSLTTLITELKEKLEIEFKEGVSKINTEFSKFFILMFGGGSALLSLIEARKKIKKEKDMFGILEDEEVLEDDDEEIDAGVDITVSLPNKRVKGLAMLSGGERALTSIALLFAISQVNPPPFIILDETDAALDEANSRKYGDMIENLSKYSQLIVITHNRETMGRAGILYGVTMGVDGYSKLLSVRFDEAVVVAK